MRIFFAIVFVVAMSACKTPRPIDSKVKVIGGQELSEDQWPSVRRLEVLVKDSTGALELRSRCTMTFIKSDLALTAAHCVCKGDRYVYKDAERWDDFNAIKVVSHPNYECSAQTPNAYDVALIWFDKKVNMPTSPITAVNSAEDLTRLLIVGYGDNILKITGSFWIANRKPITENGRPSPRKGDREFNGKRSGEVTWQGDTPRDAGFIGISAVYDVTAPIDEEMTQGASAKGDSGGPAFYKESKTMVGVISRGLFQFTGIGSKKVEAITELIDLRRSDIHEFLRINGAIEE